MLQKSLPSKRINIAYKVVERIAQKPYHRRMSSSVLEIKRGYFMSTDEEMIVRGRMVTDYQKYRERLILLVSELGRISQGFIDLGKGLQSNRWKYEIRPEQIQLLNAERLLTLIADYNETSAKTHELKEQLKALGINVI